MNIWLRKLKEITQGWANDIYPTPEVLAFAEPRAKICAECPLNVNNVCSSSFEDKAVTSFAYFEELRQEGRNYKGCGCPLSKKTKSPDSKCPLGKW